MGFRCFDKHQSGCFFTVINVFLSEASCDFPLLLPWPLGMLTFKDGCSGEVIKSTAVSYDGPLTLQYLLVIAHLTH